MVVYNTLQQEDQHGQFEDLHTPSPLLGGQHEPPISGNIDTREEKPPGAGFGGIFDSIVAKKTSYSIVEDDDYETPNSPEPEKHTSSVATSSPRSLSTTSPFVSIHIPKPRTTRSQLGVQATDNSGPKLAGPSDTILRTASGKSVDLRHPTPDLQTLQGAYMGNIEQLERTAERLSMTSSIDDAIRDLHEEQKRNDSRQSSLLSSPEIPQVVQRKISSASSIVETNNLARSGGFSPAGYMMSPIGSFSTHGRGRSSSSVSKTSRFGTRPEPEQEGRPLDSFVSVPALPHASIAEQEEETSTITRPIDQSDKHHTERQILEQRHEDRPASPSASINTFEAQQAFADFDGVHSELLQEDNVERGFENPWNQRTVPGESMERAEIDSQQKTPSHHYDYNARPMSYMDPENGQQMVYYPAPVPVMLNLPHKLSKLHSSMARNKRRSQALANIPRQARQSAIWLPDVLETSDQPELAEDDGAQQMEYVAQHQRATMGGRRLTQDVQHLPPHLRANAFFELEPASEVVELKEQSAVATLDSILDASAYAPVTAFTDHAFAGHLGAEVYGKPQTRKIRNMRSSTAMSALAVQNTSKKRTSSFHNFLGYGSRQVSSVISGEDERRQNTIADVRDGKILRDGDEEDDMADAAALEGSDSEEFEEEQEEEYTGAPTTLLAELQLRKQQQKDRVRPIGTAYPNGMHSTLLQMDAVASVEKEKRRQKRVNLAWEDRALEEPDSEDNDDDVPLALLYPNQKRVQEPDRPLGLMERRELEDNEPLSRRRDRLQGRAVLRLPTKMATQGSSLTVEDESETLAQRTLRLKNSALADDDGIPLPKARPVSGDFASEMMSQFGDLQSPTPVKDKEPESLAVSLLPEDEETMGQRRKRLQAEREAREKEVAGEPRPVVNKRKSMANILQAHPAAGAGRRESYGKPAVGLLGMHDKVQAKLEERRASTMLSLEEKVRRPSMPQPQAQRPQLQQQNSTYTSPPLQHRASSYNMYNNGQMFPQPSLGSNSVSPMMGYGHSPQMMPYANPYAMGMPMNYSMPNMNMGFSMSGMPMNMQMMGVQPLNQGQVDMVERWRQSVMH